ncbi:hypothetical protein AAFF_G00104260 [Aldrovandia affinis]|uniref:Uncharacterized protein n=1 Tax=Aldrovandia affinis TaxID=143900 RepID=A0AAD7WYG8_9TELE|nr:hypothetical protein AAFF_G00104260 [Aldrovandia affinis]
MQSSAKTQVDETQGGFFTGAACIAGVPARAQISLVKGLTDRRRGKATEARGQPAPPAERAFRRIERRTDREIRFSVGVNNNTTVFL